MFDLITGAVERPFREAAPTSKVVSLAAHAVIVTLVVGIPLLRVTNTLPDVPTIVAFVAAPPAPPPPPPPPLAAHPSKPATAPIPKPAGKLAAPIEAPGDVKPEATTGDRGALANVEGGVDGGVEGGVPGGIVGGIVGGLVSAPPSPPPPPPAPAPRAPVRVGGLITTPALIRRIEPRYPDVAAVAHLTGVVILEAVVDTEGRVESVKVLRSRHILLDRAAVDALQQWRYSPLNLNGTPTPFVLTVTFNFSVGR